MTNLVLGGRRAALALALTVAATAVATGAAQAACSMRLVTEMPVTMVENQPLVDAVIDGHPAKLLVDTGSATSALFPSAAARFGLTPYEIERSHASEVGGISHGLWANVGSLRVGKAISRGISVFVPTRDYLGGIDGVLGADFFSHTDAEFDLPHGVIRLLQPTGCAGDEVLYWGGAYSVAPLLVLDRDSDGFAIPVALNGQPVVGLLDTALALGAVSNRAAYTAGVTPPDAAPGQKGQAAVFPTLTIDQETMRNVSLPVASLFDEETAIRADVPYKEDLGAKPRMVLGTGFFLTHRVLISNSQRKVYMSYMGLGGPMP